MGKVYILIEDIEDSNKWRARMKLDPCPSGNPDSLKDLSGEEIYNQLTYAQKVGLSVFEWMNDEFNMEVDFSKD